VNNLSNDDLARLLQQPGGLPKPAPPPAPPKQPAQEPAAQIHPESLAPKHRSSLDVQQWPFGKSAARLESLTEWEKKALFVALTKGTRMNLMREPTGAEVIALIERVNEARAFVASVEQAIETTSGIHLEQGEFVFGGSAARFKRPAGRSEVA
jgi:hypothetical protein